MTISSDIFITIVMFTAQLLILIVFIFCSIVHLHIIILCIAVAIDPAALHAVL